MGERRDLKESRLTQARAMFGASVLLCALVIPISLAGAVGGSDDPEAAASASIKKKFKKLKKRVQALEGEQGQPRPPSGDAGGDLTGTYPDPSIASGVVTNPKLANGAVTNPKLATGAVTAAKVLNGSLGTSKFSSSIPAARITSTDDLSTSSGTDTSLSFDSEYYDTASMHDNTTNNTRITAPADGIYTVTAEVWWEPNATGLRYVNLRKNGITILAQDQKDEVSSSAADQMVTADVQLQAGDFIEARVLQNSGGSLDILQPGALNPYEFTPVLSMTWLAPGP